MEAKPLTKEQLEEFKKDHAEHKHSVGGGPHFCDQYGCATVDKLLATIEALLPPKGSVLTDDGVVRKVLGTLPTTADGCVVGDGASVLMPLQNHELRCVSTNHGTASIYYGARQTITLPINQCFSSMDAAHRPCRCGHTHIEHDVKGGACGVLHDSAWTTSNTKLCGCQGFTPIVPAPMDMEPGEGARLAHAGGEQDDDHRPTCAICECPLDTSRGSNDGPRICSACDGRAPSADSRPDGPFQSGPGYGGERV